MKWCPGCQQERDDFPPNRARPDGLGSYCRSCQRHQNRRHHAAHPERARERTRRRTAALREENRRRITFYLLAHPCPCGECDPAALDFHHLGDKHASVARLVSDGYPWHVIRAEVGKCVVRCANCHRKAHAAARGRPMAHRQTDPAQAHDEAAGGHRQQQDVAAD